jgi:hypothetical protein
MINLWAIAPACVGCDHQRCSDCRAGLLRDGMGSGSWNSGPWISHATTVQESQQQEVFWRCHKCLTHCPRGGLASLDEWKCTTCRHMVCWDCTSAFKNAIAGTAMPGLRSALGQNRSGSRDPMEAYISLETHSPSLVNEHGSVGGFGQTGLKIGSVEPTIPSRTNLHADAEEKSLHKTSQSSSKQVSPAVTNCGRAGCMGGSIHNCRGCAGRLSR